MDKYWEGSQMDELKRCVERETLFSLLLYRLNRTFYPLAKRSFTEQNAEIDVAFATYSHFFDLPFGKDKKEKNEIIKLYVAFRLALTTRIVEELLPLSETRKEQLKRALNPDVTKSFGDIFDGKRNAVALFSAPFTDLEKPMAQVLTLMGKEIKTNLLPALDFFQEETKLFGKAVIEEIKRFTPSFQMTETTFADKTVKTIPPLLMECILESMGHSYGSIVTESAQTLSPLSPYFFSLMKKGPTKDTYLFFYRYLVFRAYILAYFAAYLWQQPRLVNTVRDGVFKAPHFTHWLRGALANRHLLSEELVIQKELVQGYADFMSQWIFFDPGNTEMYFRYLPKFPMAISDVTERDSFSLHTRRLFTILGKGLSHDLTDREISFLVNETGVYMNNLSRSCYFAYTMGFRKPSDFISEQYKEKPVKNSLWKGIGKIFGI